MTFTLTYDSDTVTLVDPMELSRKGSDDVRTIFWRDGSYGGAWFGNIGDDVTILGRMRDPPCMYFDATTDKIDLDAGYEATGQFTFCFWGNPNSFSSSRGLFGDDTLEANGRVTLGISLVRFKTQTAETTFGYTKVIPLLKWSHFAITRDGSNDIKFYLDGVDITSGSPNQAGTIDIDRIFDNPNDSAYGSWLGYVRDIRLFSTAKSASTIQNIMDGNEDSTNLEAWWKMNYKNGTAVKDQTGDHDGTLSGVLYDGTYFDMHDLEGWCGNEISITGLPDSNMNTNYMLRNIRCSARIGCVYEYNYEINLVIV